MGRPQKETEGKLIFIQGETPKRRFPIDLGDKVQVRYEMLRQASLSRKPVAEVCRKFQYSKDMYYYYLHKFKQEGIMGLLPEKRGPREPSKRTEELEKKIIELRFNRSELNMYEINDLLKEEGYDVSPRTVARVLREHGLSKKKPEKEPGKDAFR